MNQDKISLTRYTVCGFIMVVTLTGLSFRVMSLQWLHAKDRDAMTKRTAHYKTEVYPSYRGLIVDCNEEPLVTNVPLNDLYVDKYHLDDKNVIASGVAYKRLRYTDEWVNATERERVRMLKRKRHKLVNTEISRTLVGEHNAFVVSILAKPLGIDKKELLKLIEDPKRKHFCIKKDMNEPDTDYIERLLKENHINGLSFQKRLTRNYPSPTLATHLIGYTKEYKGETGIEYRYNDLLSGVDGYHKRKSNPNNLSIYSEEEEFKLPVEGLNIKLSIDTTIQSIVEEELQLGLQEAVAEKGCAIVIDPKTGDVLAMASRPHYNLNTREGVAKGSRNYIFKTAIEPGSTFKAITAAAALNERHVTRGTRINCENGYFKDGSVVLRDEYERSYLTVSQILAKSSNIGSYKLGRQIGRERFFQYVADFGFGKPTGLDWAGEVKTKGQAGPSPQEFASATYGYAISATPMHMAVAYATLANNGKMMRPTVIKSVIANDGTIIEDNPPKMVRQVVDSDVAYSLRRALLSVTEEGGTGTKARVPGFHVAGKTGTTRKWSDGGYQKGRYICSFGGMLPVNNPDFVCYIVVDDPKTTTQNRYGGTLAAPIFANIAERTASYRNITPTEPIMTQAGLE